MALVLVYLCLAGQYESWIAPLAVILAVPLALLGPAITLGMLGLANNLYTQIGIVLLVALAAKNAILIVEVARERRAEGEPILQAAVDAARTRFRPILMTSFAFILGMRAAGHGDGSRCGSARIAGAIGIQRDDRVHLPCRAVRTVVLRRAATPGRAANCAQTSRGPGGTTGGVVKPHRSVMHRADRWGVGIEVVRVRLKYRQRRETGKADQHDDQNSNAC